MLVCCTPYITHGTCNDSNFHSIWISKPSVLMANSTYRQPVRILELTKFMSQMFSDSFTILVWDTVLSGRPGVRRWKVLFGFRTKLPVAHVFHCPWLYNGWCSLSASVFVVRAGQGRLLISVQFFVMFRLSWTIHKFINCYFIQSRIRSGFTSVVCRISYDVCGSWSVVGCSMISNCFISFRFCV